MIPDKLFESSKPLKSSDFIKKFNKSVEILLKDQLSYTREEIKIDFWGWLNKILEFFKSIFRFTQDGLITTSLRKKFEQEKLKVNFFHKLKSLDSKNTEDNLEIMILPALD